MAGSAPSQTYVVDAAGGPGANFTSIAAAVAAVPDGAVLLVRAGTYGPFAINNMGLTVLADPGVAVQGAGTPTIQIVGTTATKPVVLRNLRLGGGAIYCTACLGPVLLDQIHPAGASPTPARLSVSQCSQVTVTSSAFRGTAASTAVNAYSSQLVLVNSSAESALSGSAMAVQLSSRVQVVSSSVITYGGTCISADATSEVRLLGGTTVPGYSGYAITGFPILRLASSVSISGPLYVSSIVAIDNETLSALGGVLGGSVSATLHGADGNIAVLVLGVTGPPLFVPGIIDSWWLDPAVSASVALAVQSGPLTAMVPIPPTPTLRGQLFGFQGLFLTPTGLSVSNPYRFVIQ